MTSTTTETSKPKRWTCRKCGFGQALTECGKVCGSTSCNQPKRRVAGDSRPETLRRLRREAKSA